MNNNYNLKIFYKKFFAFFVILSISLSLVIAPSHPVVDDNGDGIDDITGENLNQEHITFGDGGITASDGILWNIEIGLEHLFGTYEDNINERLDEMHTEIQGGNTEAAVEIAEEVENTLETTETHVETVEAGTTTVEELATTEETPLHDILDIEENFIGDNGIEDKVDAIHQELTELVKSKEITEETAGEIINPVQEATAETLVSIEEQKEELVTEIAETNNIPAVEVELIVDEQEEKAGITEEHKKEVTLTEIANLEKAIEEIKIEIVEDKTEGGENEANSAKILIANAELALQQCKNALENGDFGEAFGQFTAAEHLTLNADKLTGTTFSQLTEEEVNQIKEELGNNGEEIRQEIEDATKRWKDLDIDDLIKNHPDKEEYIRKAHEQAKEVGELAEKLSNKYNEEYNKLVEDGKTSEEATAILTQQFTSEFKLGYGEEYVPPGFIEKETVEADKVKVEFGGGFVEDYEYTDPNGGEYKFGDKGYTYTSPLGQDHYFEYPQGYDSKGYSRGDESFEYILDNGDKVKYSAVGYVITKVDGTEEEHAYEPGLYDVVGGGKCNIKPTGFEHISEKGQETIFEYVPEYGNYVAEDGKVYVTDVSIHTEKTNYDGTSKKYEYSHGGERWSYDKDKDVWTSSTGQTHKPTAVVNAPVGHEEQGSFTTKHGETWNYNTETETWKSSSGNTYTPPPSAYYSYDSETGKYVDTRGNTHESSSFEHSGNTWNYNTETGIWTSSTGNTYNPSTGQSSGEHSYSTGGYYQGHTDSSGHAYDGGVVYSGGSYTGGDTGHASTGGSAPSGGDSGGGGHSSGHVIYESREETVVFTSSYKKYRLF